MIVHLIGTQCSGKTYVLSKLKKLFDFVSWDILEFYMRKEIWKNGYMNWDKFHAYTHLILPELNALLTHKNIVIESSGTNRTINAWLSKHEHVVVCLRPPKESILKERAKARGLDYNNVVKFNKILTNSLDVAPVSQMVAFRQIINCMREGEAK